MPSHSIYITLCENVKKRQIFLFRSLRNMSAVNCAWRCRRTCKDSAGSRLCYISTSPYYVSRACVCVLLDKKRSLSGRVFIAEDSNLRIRSSYKGTRHSSNHASSLSQNLGFPVRRRLFCELELNGLFLKLGKTFTVSFGSEVQCAIL